MGFSERLFGGGFPVALEITPPQRALPAVLLRRATLLGPWAAAVNVIQRPGRQSSLSASLALREAGIEPVWHLVTRGLTRDELAANIEAARAGGIRQVLCIRGDHGGADAPDALTIREAVGLTAAGLPGACIGATFNQYATDPVAAIRNLLPKLAAGATYVQTQPVFDIETLRPAVAAIRERATGTRVVAMAMPLVSVDAFEKVKARLGIELPAGLRAAIGDDGSGAWPAFEASLAALRGSGLVDGVAVMTFEMDPPPGMADHIVAALRAAGCEPAAE